MLHPGREVIQRHTPFNVFTPFNGDFFSEHDQRLDSGL